MVIPTKVIGQRLTDTTNQWCPCSYIVTKLVSQLFAQRCVFIQFEHITRLKGLYLYSLKCRYALHRRYVKILLDGKEPMRNTNIDMNFFFTKSHFFLHFMYKDKKMSTILKLQFPYCKMEPSRFLILYELTGWFHLTKIGM